MSTEIDEICVFWLGESLSGPEAAYARRDWWYKGGPDVDNEIRSRFGGFVEQACEGRLADWQSTANGSFALVLLLDQFTRNIYRNTPDAYAGDAIAFSVMLHAIESGLDESLHQVARIWTYHPFHHSEEIDEQDRGLRMLNKLVGEVPEAWHPYVNRSIWGWTRHRNIVAQFGRFPHRNKVLGRETTAEEAEFLNADGEAFGQGPA